MAEKTIKPFEIIFNEDGFPEVLSDWKEPTEEEKKAKKLYSARKGHVKRRLSRNQPLTGELLEFAIDIVMPHPEAMKRFEDEGSKDKQTLFNLEIARKLRAGEPLNDYESSMMLDIWLSGPFG